jgi:hypothetical protein
MWPSYWDMTMAASVLVTLPPGTSNVRSRPMPRHTGKRADLLRRATYPLALRIYREWRTEVSSVSTAMAPFAPKTTPQGGQVSKIVANTF